MFIGELLRFEVLASGLGFPKDKVSRNNRHSSMIKACVHRTWLLINRRPFLSFVMTRWFGINLVEGIRRNNGCDGISIRTPRVLQFFMNEAADLFTFRFQCLLTFEGKLVGSTSRGAAETWWSGWVNNKWPRWMLLTLVRCSDNGITNE